MRRVLRRVLRRPLLRLLAVRADRWLLAVVVIVLAYFAYHAFSGSRGLIAVRALDGEIEATRAELEGIVAERVALERKVERMRTESLDLDLLDERARAVLGLIGEDEVIVLIEEE